MNKPLIIFVGVGILLLVTVGFLYLQPNFVKQNVNRITETLPQSQTNKQENINLPAEQQTVKLAVGVFVPGQVSPQVKEKGVVIFDSQGKQTGKIDLPLAGIDLNDPPVILDWSKDGRFLALARNDCCDNNLYIYDFSSKKLDSVPDNAEMYGSISGNEITFSPNGNFFLAPRNSGRWIGYRDNPGWKVADLTTIIPENNISLMYDFGGWNPTEPATIFAFGFKGDINFGWIINFQNGFDKAQILPVSIFPQLQKDGFRISSFRWSDDGKSAVVGLWKSSDNSQLNKTDILSFSGSGFTVLKENIEAELSSVLPLKDRERFSSFRISPISQSRIFVLKQTMYPVTEEDLNGPGGFYAARTPIKDEWWIYDFQTKSLKKFFSEEAQGVFNDYFWSPTDDYLAIRSEGTFRLISPDGTQVIKDTMQASNTAGGYWPDHSFSWDKIGKYLVYLASATETKYNRVVGSSPAQDVLENTDGGGAIKLYDLISKTTNTISVPNQWFASGRGTASLLLK